MKRLLLLCLFLLPIFAFANPPVKKLKPDLSRLNKKTQIKPNPTTVNERKKESTPLKPNRQNPLIKPSKSKPDSKSNDQQRLIQQPDTSKGKNKAPHEDKQRFIQQPHEQKDKSKLVELPEKPQPKKPEPHDIKLKPKDIKHQPQVQENDPPRRPNHQPRPQQQAPRQPQQASGGFLNIFNGCQPTSALRIGMGKSFGLYGDRQDTPLNSIDMSVGYRFYFLSVLAETEINGFSGTKFQLARAMAALNIPIGCLSISPMAGVGMISQDLSESQRLSYEYGLMLEYHLISLFAVNMKYIFHYLDGANNNMIHSLTLGLALYF